MKNIKIIGLALTMFIGILTAHSQTTQTDTIKEAKTNLIKYMNLTASMLSESSGYEIQYDANGDGKPVDRKYTAEKRLSYLSKASEHYKEIASHYNTVKASLTKEEREQFELIDNSFAKLLKGDDYKKIISKQTATLSLQEIFPTIQFIEIVKVKIEKLEKELLK